MINSSSQISTVSLQNPYLQNIPDQKMNDIFQFVQKHGLALKNEAKKIQQPIHVPPKNSSLIRSILFDPSGEVFILLNKKKEGDLVLYRSSTRTETAAVSLLTGKSYRSISYVPKDGKQEILMQRYLAGISGIPQAKNITQYATTKAPRGKMRALYPLENNTRDFLSHVKDLTRQEKIKVFASLIRTVADVHHKNIVVRNIVPSTILLSGYGRNIQATITNLEIATGEFDLLPPPLQCSPTYAAPELAGCVLDGSINDLILSKKQDIWSLGLITAKLFNLTDFFPRKGEDAHEQFVNNRDYQEAAEPISGRSFEQLIWRMLRKNPLDRITANELSKILSSCNESWTILSKKPSAQEIIFIPEEASWISKHLLDL
jgi:hypothetical protein